MRIFPNNIYSMFNPFNTNVYQYAIMNNFKNQLKETPDKPNIDLDSYSEFEFGSLNFNLEESLTSISDLSKTIVTNSEQKLKNDDLKYINTTTYGYSNKNQNQDNINFDFKQDTEDLDYSGYFKYKNIVDKSNDRNKEEILGKINQKIIRLRRELSGSSLRSRITDYDIKDEKLLKDFKKEDLKILKLNLKTVVNNETLGKNSFSIDKYSYDNIIYYLKQNPDNIENILKYLKKELNLELNKDDFYDRLNKFYDKNKNYLEDFDILEENSSEKNNNILYENDYNSDNSEDYYSEDEYYDSDDNKLEVTNKDKEMVENVFYKARDDITDIKTIQEKIDDIIQKRDKEKYMSTNYIGLESLTKEYNEKITPILDGYVKTLKSNLNIRPKDVSYAKKMIEEMKYLIPIEKYKNNTLTDKERANIILVNESLTRNQNYGSKTVKTNINNIYDRIIKYESKYLKS